MASMRPLPWLLLAALLPQTALAFDPATARALGSQDCIREPEPERAEPEEEDRYAWLAEKHDLEGRACYYSAFFDGRKTANGEIFRNNGMTAAHLTLPLGTWVEVRSLSTGKSIRVKVNDRGPYTGGFVIDLSRGAARRLGVDTARDRRVELKVLALPGEEFNPDAEEAPTEEVATLQADGNVTQNVDP
jgi:rare lipoprotein A